MSSGAGLGAVRRCLSARPSRYASGLRLTSAGFARNQDWSDFPNAEC